MARGRPADTQRAAAAFTTLLSLALSELDDDVYVAPERMAELVRARTRQLVVEYGSFPRRCVRLVLQQEHDEPVLTEALTTWSPETDLTKALLSMPGVDSAMVAVRVRGITSKTNALRRVLSAAIRELYLLIHRAALQVLKQKLPPLHCAMGGEENALLVVARLEPERSNMHATRGAVCHACMLHGCSSP